VNIRFQQARPHLAKSLTDVLLREHTTPAQPPEDLLSRPVSCSNIPQARPCPPGHAKRSRLPEPSGEQGGSGLSEQVPQVWIEVSLSRTRDSRRRIIFSWSRLRPLGPRFQSGRCRQARPGRRVPATSQPAPERLASPRFRANPPSTSSTAAGAASQKRRQLRYGPPSPACKPGRRSGHDGHDEDQVEMPADRPGEHRRQGVRRMARPIGFRAGLPRPVEAPGPPRFQMNGEEVRPARERLKNDPDR